MKNWEQSDLPVNKVYPELLVALSTHAATVLTAEPGAGKSTLVPMRLMCESLCSGGKIIMLEPRRLAASMLANFLASSLGEKVGERVGFAIRGEKRISSATRLLIVTEGILVKMFQNDMTLDGASLIIFDEFHERHLAGDLSLAMALDVQRNLRPELKILLMSATLDAKRLSKFLDNAPVISAAGRAYPLEIFHDINLNAEKNSTRRTIKSLFRAVAENPGKNILAFLPGAREISEAAQALRGAVAPDCRVIELHGNLSSEEQRFAVESSSYKIILATNIAETSLTIDNVSIVVDSGWERRMSFDYANLLNRLESVRISRQSALQRAGRAGRIAPGKVYRAYTQAEFERLLPERAPEILTSDLSSLALELALWGSSAGQMRFVDPPPEAALESALRLLRELGAIDKNHQITLHGKNLARLPLHPRLANMLEFAKAKGALSLGIELASLIEERDAAPDSSSADIGIRLSRLRAGKASRNIKEVEKQLQEILGVKGKTSGISDISTGVLIAKAYPDRIAGQRKRHGVEYLLAGGWAAKLRQGDDLATFTYLAAAKIEGGENDAFIRLASPIDEAEIREYFPENIENKIECRFDFDKKTVFGARLEKLGAIVLKTTPVSPPGEVAAKLLLDYLEGGDFQALKLTKKAAALLARMNYAGVTPEWRNILHPYLATGEITGLNEINSLDLFQILNNSMSKEDSALLKNAPESITLPDGKKIPLDYSSGHPTLSCRAQMLYGMKTHPKLGKNQTPLRIELLSPAGRPIQVTSDLPNFWQNNWRLVRKEMKSRYPKHSWPENPLSEE